jgi:kilA domain protein
MEATKKTTSITVQDVPVTIMNVDQRDYISLTDMAKARTDAGRAADVIKNWLRARSTLEFLGTWEIMYNPNFKVVEFDHFKSEAGLHTFTLSAKEWIEKTNAVGIYVQAGRYGGTYAHKDIAFEFGSAISPVFKLYLLKEYQRLKDAENDRLKLEWSAKRFLSKNNYLIHTDAVKNYVLPQSNYTKNTEWLAYADEADLLNVALFGCTAKAWREANPTLAKNSNIRDYASIAELTVLSNLETHNAELIKSRMEKKERFEALRQIAQYQLRVLAEAEKIKELPTLEDKS